MQKEIAYEYEKIRNTHGFSLVGANHVSEVDLLKKSVRSTED